LFAAQNFSTKIVRQNIQPDCRAPPEHTRPVHRIKYALRIVDVYTYKNDPKDAHPHLQSMHQL